MIMGLTAVGLAATFRPLNKPGFVAPVWFCYDQQDKCCLSDSIQLFSMKKPFVYWVLAMLTGQMGWAQTCTVPESQTYGTVADRYAIRYWTDTNPYGTTYDVQWRAVGTTPWSSTLNLSPQYGGNYLMTNLSGNTTYEWQVRARCPNSTQSAFSVVATFTTLPPEPCAAPVAFTANVTSGNQATLVVQDNAYLNAQQYGILWRSTGSTSWNTVLAQKDNPYAGYLYYPLTGLTPGGSYEWQARAVCSPGYSSTYSAPNTFTTYPPIVVCESPTTLTTSDIIRSGARFTWNETNPGSRYDVRWRVVGAATWTTILNWTATTYPWATLLPVTTYEWQVRTQCWNGESSGWSALTTFTTPLCDPLLAPTTIVYIEGKARFNWSVATGSTNYPVTIRYRLKNSANAWIMPPNFGNGDLVSGLTPGSAYEWQVQNNCPNPTSVSDWTPLTSFTALGCVPPPNTNIVGGGFSGGAAYVNLVWRRDFYFENQTFNTRWRKVGTATWLTADNISGGGFGQFIGNLETNAAYEWQGQTICTGGGTSAFSPSYIFSTIPGFFPQGSFYTISDGDWTDYRIWSTGRLPDISYIGGYATPVEIRHRITLPVGYIAPVQRITYTTMGSLLLRAGARVVLYNSPY